MPPEALLRRRAWAIGMAVGLAAAASGLFAADTSMRRRLVDVRVDLERAAVAAEAPHRAYLEPPLQLAGAIAELRARGVDPQAVRRVAVAGFERHPQLVVLAYRSPVAGRGWILPENAAAVDVEALERASGDRPVAVVDLASSGRTLVLRLPVVGAPGDAVLSVVRLDPLYEELVGTWSATAPVEVQVHAGDTLVWGTPPPADAVPVRRDLTIAGQPWTARLWPLPVWLASEASREWWMVARVAFGGALVLAALVVWSLLRWWRMARGILLAEQRTRLVVDRALDAVVTLDPEGRVTGWNPRAEAVFGWAAQEAQGRRVVDLIVPVEDREACAAGIARFVAGNAASPTRRIELRALRRDGATFPVELSVSAFQLGAEVTLTAFLRDISERKEAELQLREAKDAAEAANRAKSEFLATMSHEIRTPMNGIFGMTELALDTPDEGERRDFLLRARACAESLMTIINDVLDFSKVEAGKLDLEAIDFDPAGVLEGVLDTLAIEGERKGIELVGTVGAAVPSRLRGDPGRLRQVLMNLAGNALKFTEVGEIAIRLEPDPERGAPPADGRALVAGEPFRLRCTVRDTGIGIPADKQAAIFDSFTQADSSTTRRYGGTGLGLAISQRLVGLMGGRIWVESAPGVGSTFGFVVPLDVGEQAVAGRAHGRLAGLRVLVMEANATAREQLAETLGAAGATVETASGVEEALARMTRAAADDPGLAVAVVDGRVAGNDQRGILDRLDEIVGRVPAIVAITGIVDAERAGVSATLAKPVKQERLVELVATVASGPSQCAVATPTRSGHTAHILVVDDNEANRLVAQTMLRRAGYEVTLAASGSEALAIVQASAPDLVLMDVQMPDLDGVETTAAIRADAGPGRNVPVVALTATTSVSDRRRCEAAGMNDYLVKPLRREDLLSTVGRILAGTSTSGDAARTPAAARPAEARDGFRDPLLDEDLMAEITEKFLDDAIERCRLLREAVREGAAETVQRIGHHIKGGAAQLEIHGVRELAAAVEVLGRDGQVEPVEALLPILEKEIQGLREARSGPPPA